MHAARTAGRWAAYASVAAMAVAMQAGSASAANVMMASAHDELADLSLEELSNIEITSVSRRRSACRRRPRRSSSSPPRTSAAPAPHSLPEALRLAPNLQVARVNAGQYAISARGFNNAIGNKLLVLIDGRTVYTPLFSGVFWDSQDVMLEDVERIEVISGPGGTLWGANAVNGVINVITRTARDTQGALVAAGGGNRQNGRGGPLRRRARRRRQLSRLRNGLRPRQHAARRRHVRCRDGWQQRPGRLSRRLERCRATASRCRATPTRRKPTPGPLGDHRTTSGANLLARWTRQLRRRLERPRAGLLRPHRARRPAVVRRHDRHLRRRVPARVHRCRRSTASCGAAAIGMRRTTPRRISTRSTSCRRYSFRRIARWTGATCSCRTRSRWRRDRQADARHQGREQRLHRRRIPAERAAGVEAGRRPAGVGRAVARGARTGAPRPRFLLVPAAAQLPPIPHRRRAGLRVRSRQRGRARLPRPADERAVLFGHRFPQRLRQAAQRPACAGRRAEHDPRHRPSASRPGAPGRRRRTGG